MRQYLEVKDRHPDGIVFFRLGDFYEMFFEDAVLGSEALDLTLTTRDKGREDAIPMCGVPHHSARAYVHKLTELGHKVIICEQVEDPRLAKGIVKREVTRVITPGIVLDEEMLDAKAPRYLAAVALGAGGAVGLAYLDVTTGEFRATELVGLRELEDELARVEPREILAAASDIDGEGRADGDPGGADGTQAASQAGETAQDGAGRAPLARLRRVFPRTALTAVAMPDAGASAAVLGPLAEGVPPLAQVAAAATVDYARATQPAGALPLARLVVYRPEDTLVLDDTSKTNLEIVETIVGRSRRGSLLGVLDHTRTAPGGRLLRRWLLFPLTDVAQIRRRQDAVEH